jgi:hypothetical protein
MLRVSTFYVTPIAMNAWEPILQFVTFLLSFHEMSIPCQIRTTTCISFNHIPLLSSMNRHYVHQRWNSHLSWHCHCQPNTSKFTSLILHNLKICSLWSSSSQKKELSRPTPHWSIPPFRTHPPSPLLIFYK